jgi:hypothetical protein
LGVRRQVEAERPWSPVEARFGKVLRIPDRKPRFLTPKSDERGVRREEDDERITVRLRSFHAGQDVFVGYR